MPCSYYGLNSLKKSISFHVESCAFLDFICSIFNVNIKGVFNVTQTLSPKLKDGAAVVNMSSQAARRALLGHTVYTASKAAVDYLSKSLALEFGPRKIRVNSLNPTAILTNMGRAVWSDPAKSGPLLNRIPLRR